MGTMTKKAHQTLWYHLSPWIMQAMTLTAQSLGWISWPWYALWAPLLTYAASILIAIVSTLALAYREGKRAPGRHQA
jgi:hypothetical protein